MARGSVKFPALMMNQRGRQIYQFHMTAEELAEFAQVDRWGESSDGVNRKLDERHAIQLAQAMVDQEDMVLLDAICGDLKGSWRFERGMLVATNGAYLSIDDGQHRWYAITELLVPEEREQWGSFNIVATMGLDYETRLRIFRQQRLRKQIDSKLDLAQRHKLDDWKTPAEREAYKLLLNLNSDSQSPLKGMIILDETVRRTYENQHRPEGINAAGLWQTLKSAMSKGSPLYPLSVEKRVEVVRNMIWLASETWENAWESPNHILCTARGINAVLKMMVSSPEFRGVIGDDFTIESLRKAFELAKRFKWDKTTWKNQNPTEITEALNRAIGSARQRELATVRA